MIIAGIDEAGYGPLLGPLVVSATAFELEGVALEVGGEAAEGGGPCLWKLLKGAVAKKAPAKKGRLLVTDSKIVHHLAEGTKLLERGVLAFLRSMAVEGGEVTELTAGHLMERLACVDHELEAHPWYAPREVGIPWLAEAGDLAIATNMLMGAMAGAKVKTACMRTAVVSEKRFNRLVEGTNNKASALVSLTLTHLYHLHHAYGHRGLMVGIDKQGGRDHYTGVLLQYFPEAQLRVLVESAKGSSYLLVEGSAQGERRTVVHFREKGDSAFFPTALASMVCKYLRELCMHSFNGWWCGKIEGLRPTAGYYGDGTRWLGDVEPHFERLAVRREMLVRIR
jgi:hypothetical protein